MLLLGEWILAVLGISIGAIAVVLAYLYYSVYNGFGDQTGVYRKLKKGVALSFDDGPSEYTENILDELKRHNVKGTFFFTSSNACRFPHIVRRAKREGHAIGCHTANHKMVYLMGDNAMREQVGGAKKDLEKILRKKGIIRLFRPPRGILDSKGRLYLIRLGMKIVLWSKTSADWSGISSKRIISNVKRARVADGDILLFHDVKPNTAKSIGEIVKLLKNKRLNLVRIEEENLV